MRLGYNARLSLGLIVVTVLTLVFCWQTSVYIEKTADNLAVYLTEMRGAVQAEDWPAAAQYPHQGFCGWQPARPLWVGVLYNNDGRKIYLSLHSLAAFAQEQRSDEVFNQLSLLDYYLKLAVESDKVNLSNLF